jgi:serine/threonine protein kinase/Tol biopolymer transport system component
MENTAMDSERWQNVERLYHATLECEERQRDAFLTSACCGDETLRREVESLVSYGKRTTEFIEGSALEVVAPALAREEDSGSDECQIIGKMIGKRISQYRIVEHLGSGGMGEVYRAVRADDQFQKQVAIKLLHAGEASGFVVGRFKRERQILASFDHPNIARLLDGGATEEGVPYFVMELVQGQPIDKYCDSNKLGIATRLKLFLQVCSALEYAHQHQIIHRDIKPSNILVTAEGVPKLLDFGIAKILDTEALPGVAGEVGKTQTMFRAFTPEYASPEQIKAEPISTGSDVYSLGVLLYGLLTGHRPYRFKTRTPLEIERAICEEEPLKPSTLVTLMEEQTLADGTTTSITPEEVSGARGSNPKQMHSCLLGDLDAIVMTALRKEPQRRYASMHDLSEDIRKHVDGLPITARPSTIAYRGTKFIRRHRELAVSALVFLVLVLVGGLAIVRRREVSKPRPRPEAQVVRRQLTANAPGDPVTSAAISRDGKYLAYGDQTGKMYLLQIDGGALRRLPFSDFFPLEWFPDGDHLLVQRRGQDSSLLKLFIGDGTSRQLLDSFGDEAISPDGSHIAYLPKNDGSEIWLMGSDGEERHRIAAVAASDVVSSLAWSPSGNRLAYTRLHDERGKFEVVIETCDLRGSHRTLVLSEPRLVGQNGASDVYWLPDGRILYSFPDPPAYSDSNIWAVVTDTASGKPLGPPTRLMNGVGDSRSFQASTDGRRIIYMSTPSSDAVYLGNLKLGAHKFNPRRLTFDQWSNWPSDWTRDSKAVLYHSFRSDRSAILNQRIDQQSPEILFSGALSYLWPVLSPAGDRLLYTTTAITDFWANRPSSRLMSMPVNGGSSSVLLTGGCIYHCGSVLSARCIVSEVKGHQLIFSVLDPVDGKGAEIQRVEVPLGTKLRWSLSPDGEKIAIVDPRASAGEIGILTVADRKVVTLTLQGWRGTDVQSIAWSADESHLFATADIGTSFVLLFIDLHGTLQVLTEVPHGQAWLSDPVPSPDGHYLAYTQRTFEGNVTMLEHF